MGVPQYAAGIDLNRRLTQICRYCPETDETITGPMKIGNEPVSFRDILDACEEQYARRTDGLTDDRPEYAGFSWQGEPEPVQRRLQEQAADLFRQAFATIGITDPGRQLQALVISMPELSVSVIELVRAVCGRLGLDRSRAFLQDYRESFYYHTFYQKKELHARKAGLFYFHETPDEEEGEETEVSFYSLSQNSQTRPVSVTCQESAPVRMGGDPAGWDSIFCDVIRDSLRNEMYSSLFLMGDLYEQSLMPRATSLLCSAGRKVFFVDSLFARGACCAAREKASEGILHDWIYLGDDLVRSNIGMEMIVQGSSTMYPVIAAGISWYDASASFSCLLEEGSSLVFCISGADGRTGREERLELTGLPSRPPKACRLEVSLAFSSPDRCSVEVRDAGFGDLFPSSGLVWRCEWEDL